jgi:hypothetical protein
MPRYSVNGDTCVSFGDWYGAQGSVIFDRVGSNSVK